jgi:hypothetical protein
MSTAHQIEAKKRKEKGQTNGPKIPYYQFGEIE